MPPSFTYRHFAGIEDHHQAEELQSRVWRGDAHIPSNMMITLQRHGGIAMGAFDADNTLQGFVLSFTSPTSIPGAHNGLSQHSHIAAVAPELQGSGVGEQLKRAQRKAALHMGHNLMTWTYDPLESRNGNLNIRKLGAIVRTFIADCYGPMDDELNRGLPSDRFEPEWWLIDEERARWNASHAGRLMEIEIADDFQGLKQRDNQAALTFRLRKREEFLRAFDDDYVVIGFVRTPGRAAYQLGQFKGARLKNH